MSHGWATGKLIRPDSSSSTTLDPQSDHVHGELRVESILLDELWPVRVPSPSNAEHPLALGAQITEEPLPGNSRHDHV